MRAAAHFYRTINIIIMHHTLQYYMLHDIKMRGTNHAWRATYIKTRINVGAYIPYICVCTYILRFNLYTIISIG